VQRLKSNTINPAAKVVITTIQRLYSMLKGEPPDVVYNAGIPPEFVDVVIVDECHRSICELWA